MTYFTVPFKKAFLPYGRVLKRLWDACSMAAKLSLLLSGLILIMSAFYYTYAVYQSSREIKTSAIYKGQAIAEAMKSEVAYGLQSQSFPTLDFTFRRLASSRNNVAYVFLVDQNGLVLAHSEPEEVGRVFDDAVTALSLTSPTTRVQFQRLDLDGHGEMADLCDVSVPIIVHAKRTATLRIGISITQSIQANAPRIRENMALFTLPFAFLSILIAIKLSSSFTRPLEELARAATRISHGDYDLQLPLQRRDELGEVAHAFNEMATNLKENFAKVSDMANRDGLTGLYNARFFQEAIARDMERVKRSGRPFSVLIFDADRFKRINDRYGHPVGDQILQHISRIARSVLRGYDVLARYGGEEFIAMLTDTTGSQGLLLAERLRKTIEQRPYVTDDADAIKMTISVGVAQARAPYDAKALISEADQALYRAKETGRNRVISYKPFSPEFSGSQETATETLLSLPPSHPPDKFS